MSLFKFSTPSPLHVAAAALYLSMTWLAGSAPVAAQSQTPEPVWISLGEDAFQTLQQQTDLGLNHFPLKAAERRAGLVTTRVHTSDLLKISALLHETHNRCGGFMVHDSADEASKALDRHRLPELEALPKAFDIDQGPRVRSLVSKLGKNRIRGTMEHLSTRFNNRFYDHASGRDASIYLRNLWRDYARSRPEVSVALREHAGWPQPSVVATIPGSRFPDEIVVLGGHLDSIAPGSSSPSFSAPGADDNASGIAVLSELLRATLANGFRPDRTVQIMGYAAEEVGLRGSQEIAQQYRRDGKNVVAVMQLDMTAYNGSSEDIVLVADFTNAELNRFTERLIDTYQGSLRRTTTLCGYACSDHASWTASGFPATFPHEARFGQGNPLIHTTQDVLSTFGNQADHALKFAHLAAAFMVETAFLPAEVPAAPSGLEAEATASGGVTLRWTDNSDNESRFEIEQDGGNGYELVASPNADTTSWATDGLPSGTEHHFRIRALGAGGASDYSNTATAVTAGEPPPGNLQATAVSAEAVRLTWVDRSAGETGYRIEGHDGDGTFTTMAEVAAGNTEATIEGLASQTTYTFRARTLGGRGDSTPSNTAEATTFVGDPEPCVPGPSTLCLQKGRFKVEVDWAAGEDTGRAQTVAGGSDDSGLLWFFSADNWEMLVKVLDGCSFNDRFWVFAAATTDLGFALSVTDSWTGQRVRYLSPEGQAAETVTDSGAFETCDAVDPMFPRRP